MPSKKNTSARELLFGDLWEFDPAPESAPAFIESRYGLFIGGKTVAPRSRKYFDSISPRDGKKLTEIPLANAADVDAAYQAAATAFKSWSKLPGKERGKYLFRIARLLQDRSREFAVAETLDGGKPITESRDFDLPMAAAHFFYHAGWADKLDHVAPGRTLVPLGVIGQVIPWNFPLLMLAWKIAPALATGNTVVLKPAETTSITALKFASILQDAGLPPGVVNIVTGAGETGATVVNHPLAAKIAFTGSTEVGKIIQRALAGTGKKLSLELGGKAANIVFDDAPLDQVPVEGSVGGRVGPVHRPPEDRDRPPATDRTAMNGSVDAERQAADHRQTGPGRLRAESPGNPHPVGSGPARPDDRCGLSWLETSKLAQVTATDQTARRI